jgi:colanic acid biosynthesis glycosyl transferase WcaI
MKDSPSILIVTQVYVPDPAAVGQHIADVAEECARRGWRVVVYTAARGYDDPARKFPAREQLRGVDVRRLPLSSFGKSSIAIRLLAGLLFLLQAVVAGCFVRGVSTVLVSTSPPFAGAGGAFLARVHRAALVWWVMDLNPDQLIATGKLAADSLPARFFRWLNRMTVTRANDVIVLDRFMRDRLLKTMPDEGKIRIVPPFYHGGHGQQSDHAGSGFRAAHGLDGRFVVMYSGNHALQHPLATLLDAARELEAEQDMAFVFIGGGAGKRSVEERVAAGARNLLSLPFQPLETIEESLSAADVHVVSMGDEVVGILHPSKIYGAMAVGRPILFFGPRASAAGELVAAHGIGSIVAHGDVAGAVRAIHELRSRSDAERADMGRRAAAVAREEFSPEAARDRVCDLLTATANRRPLDAGGSRRDG